VRVLVGNVKDFFCLTVSSVEKAVKRTRDRVSLNFEKRDNSRGYFFFQDKVKSKISRGILRALDTANDKDRSADMAIGILPIR